MPKHLHLISFNVPYPADNGGVIDVFYKIKALHAQGVKVHLHCFVYNRPPHAHLEEFCEEVCYYHRCTGVKSAMHIHPFIVQGRKNKALVERLGQDHYPILLDGIHSAGLLLEKSLRHRHFLYRAGNVEHVYYHHLAKNETESLFKKCYYRMEAIKLHAFEHYLNRTRTILAISECDAAYFSRKFPQQHIVYLPAFHPCHQVESRTGCGSYTLYHGNLAIPENYRAATFLVERVFAEMPKYSFYIAGANPTTALQKLVAKHKNVKLISNPSDEEMEQLIREAHVNLLVTFQQTGLKLKLLHALYLGRFCLVNESMLFGTGLTEVCHVANVSKTMQEQLQRLFGQEFSDEMLQYRKEVLEQKYSNNRHAALLADLL